MKNNEVRSSQPIQGRQRQNGDIKSRDKTYGVQKSEMIFFRSGLEGAEFWAKRKC